MNVVTGIVVTLTLHFVWEMLQAQAFVDFAVSTWKGTVRCFGASLGDLLLATGAYVVTALLFRRLDWPIRRHWVLPAATWIGLGELATIAFERWAVARGRWAYGPEMPLVFGIGLLPLVQWIVVPALTLAIVRARMRRPCRALARGASRHS